MTDEVKCDFEFWIPVPDTERRFWVSNFGHLLKMARKKRRCSKLFLEFCDEPRPLVADYKSGVIGWYAFYDGENHFLPRDELMNLIPPNLRNVDTSRDDEALKLMKDTFRDLEKERAEKAAKGE